MKPGLMRAHLHAPKQVVISLPLSAHLPSFASSVSSVTLLRCHDRLAALCSNVAGLAVSVVMTHFLQFGRLHIGDLETTRIPG